MSKARSGLAAIAPGGCGDGDNSARRAEKDSDGHGAWSWPSPSTRPRPRTLPREAPSRGCITKRSSSSSSDASHPRHRGLLTSEEKR